MVAPGLRYRQSRQFQFCRPERVDFKRTAPARPSECSSRQEERRKAILSQPHDTTTSLDKTLGCASLLALALCSGEPRPVTSKVKGAAVVPAQAAVWSCGGSLRPV